jgi:hypothetical protein
MSAALPKGRLFPSSRDDLIECAALLDCVRRDELDLLRIPSAPLDVLAQQIVAEVACREWNEDELFDMVRRAAPYAQLEREQFDAVVRMLAEGYTGRNGVRGAYLHRDTVAGTLRARRGGKLTAVTSGGTIPDNADYSVVLEPQGQWSARCTRTSPSRAWPATFSSWGTRPTASSASRRARCGSRMRTARRRTSRSGWARRRAAATSCRWAWRGCAARSTDG